MRAILAAALLLLASAAGADAQTDAAARFVVVQRGQMPVILSAPHGGPDRLPGVPDRKRPDPANPGEFARWGGFAGGLGDVGTFELTQEAAAIVKARLGKAPYLVMNRVQRRHVDMNRPAHLAYDAPGTDGPKLAYDAYHQALAEFCREVARTYGRGLLLDIHGQGEARDSIFRGTLDGRTVTHLLNKDGRAALTGPESIFGFLAAKGHDVIPAVGSAALEDPRYRGGFISVTYGGGARNTIDAIQLEFGTNLRAKEGRPKTAEDLADAIVRFAEKYLPKAPAGR